MPFDTYNFLVVCLAGFVAVWSFRKAAGHTGRLGEFEYLGLSAFWGLVIIVTYAFLLEDDAARKRADEFFKNPYAVGLALSVSAAPVAFFAGWATRIDFDKVFDWLKKRLKRHR